MGTGSDEAVRKNVKGDHRVNIIQEVLEVAINPCQLESGKLSLEHLESFVEGVKGGREEHGGIILHL